MPRRLDLTGDKKEWTTAEDMQFNHIQHWLNAIKPDNESLSPASTIPTSAAHEENGTATKRSRADPITPPVSDTRSRLPVDMDMTLPVRSDGTLDDETPRAKRQKTSYPTLSSASSDHSPSSSCRSARTSSPQKQLRTLQQNPCGLDVRDMYNMKYVSARPPALKKLLNDIEAFADGQGIVARDAQDALVRVAGSNELFSWALRGGATHISDDEDLVGRTPPPGAVLKVMKAAVECNEKKLSEAAWNCEVHQRILDMAFRPTEETDFENLIDFTLCTTASILPEYGIPTLSKKVDFCVYIEPKNDPSLSPTFWAKVSHARQVMPRHVLNFTDYAGLFDRFIALSIETKKPSENFEAAQLQLGVWDRARWRFLRRLVGLPVPAGVISLTGEISLIGEINTTGKTNTIGETNTTGAPGSADAAGTAGEIGSGSQQTKLPEFLPGMIVQGHNWFLVITTMEGEKTVLWEHVLVGSTSKPRGIYQIIRTLQYLGRRAKDVDWPWLKRCIEESFPAMEA